MATKIDGWKKCELTDKEVKLLRELAEGVFKRNGGRGEMTVVSFKGWSGKEPTISFDEKLFVAGNIPAKDREGPEFAAKVKLWAEAIMAGDATLEQCTHDKLRAAVSRALVVASDSLPLPPVKDVLPMPPKRMVTEEGPVGSTITRNVKRGNKMQKAS
jgi:hypothetical protein